MGMSLDHNIPDVQSDVADVADDIRDEMKKRVGRAMRVLWADTRQYVLDDPQASGNLFRNIEREIVDQGGNIELSVFVDTSDSGAPYAAVVEYGSGRRRETSHTDSEPFPPFTPDENKPPDYPYSAPDIKNIEGFAYYLQEWMLEKNLEPRAGGSLYAAAIGIAKTIRDKGTYAHPFLRPAWFDNELQVKRAARNAVTNAAR